ncbi:hypothetical protein ABT358_31190 [Streptomyces sp. NPDC000341]|uniref:hypothetical protein n=1 Tax=Streptomyces sp. NPDC000341 TaxID=3156645 RepID=UPI0033288654
MGEVLTALVVGESGFGQATVAVQQDSQLLRLRVGGCHQGGEQFGARGAFAGRCGGTDQDVQVPVDVLGLLHRSRAALLLTGNFWEWNGPSCSYCHGWSGQRLTADQHEHYLIALSSHRH